MKLVKIGGLATFLMGLAALAVAVAPAVYGQSRRADRDPGFDAFRMPGGSQIGATVREPEASEARDRGGVYVEEVRTDSAAEKAGIKHGDIITKWDGEAVRSVRQFTRLVQETPAGRTVQATVVRDGKSSDLKVTASEGSRAGVFLDGDRLSGDINGRLQEQLGQLRERMNRVPFNFDFDFDPNVIVGGARLGVTVDEITPQLATYFGVKDGVLVASVENDSPASRAGLKAGDVITAVSGQNVSSRGDLVRTLRSARADGEVTIEIVRDKKESSVKAKLDDGPARARRPALRSLRPVRSSPA